MDPTYMFLIYMPAILAAGLGLVLVSWSSISGFGAAVVITAFSLASSLVHALGVADVRELRAKLEAVSGDVRASLEGQIFGEEIQLSILNMISNTLLAAAGIVAIASLATFIIASRRRRKPHRELNPSGGTNIDGI